MSNCCGSTNNGDQCGGQNNSPRKFTCPSNHQQYIEVSKKTIIQQITSPWQHQLNDQQYYFCDDPDCDVVYFGLDGSVINKSELRMPVGVKESDEDTLICYCFGVSKTQANENTEIKTYVTQQTKEKNCACDIRNPSGRCCLKDFPKKH